MARLGRYSLLLVAVFSFALGAVSVTARSDEEKDATPKPAAKATSSPLPMYPVPDGTVAELFEFAKTLPKMKFEGESFDEYKEHARKVRRIQLNAP